MDGDQAERWIEGLELFGMRYGLERMQSLTASLGHPLAGLPAVLLSTCKLATAISAHFLYPGPNRKVFFKPRSTI